MRTPQSKVIDGYKVEVTPWAPRHGIRIQARLGRIASPLIKTAKANNLMESEIFDVLASVLDKLDDAEAEKLIIDILQWVTVDGKDLGNPKNFDDIFAANYMFMYKVVWFSLQVNMGNDFLGVGQRHWRPTKQRNGKVDDIGIFSKELEEEYVIWYLIAQGAVRLDEVDGPKATYTTDDVMRLYSTVLFLNHINNPEPTKQ